MTDTSPPVTDRATVRLRPKANARAIRHGTPWVYADELVTDRRTKALKPGTLARLEDSDRVSLGLVGVTPASKIIARVLDPDPTADLNTDWFAAKFEQALSLRERLFPDPFYRLIHAEADGLPGVVIDRFGDAAVIQPNAAWAEQLLGPMTEALMGVTGVKTVVKNAASRARAREGLDAETKVLHGAIDAPVPVSMNGATYMADLLGGQKTGLFYDQRPNHAFAAGLAKDATVLDMFSHVGGFGLAALAGGASSALCVDGSQPALDLAEAGADAAGVRDRLTTRKGDAFDVLEALRENGSRFDLVICDPPAFAPAKAALEAGLRAYERVARLSSKLVTPGGYLVLCSCSHAADLSQFRRECLRGIGRAGRRAQIVHTGSAGPDHPQHPMLAESGYLKALFFRMM